MEKIIELEADVVFVSGQTAADSVSALNEAGINVYSIGAKDLDGIYKGITDVGQITGTSEKGSGNRRRHEKRSRRDKNRICQI